MKFRYLPVTEEDRKEMLETIGVKSVEELFQEIPASVRFNGSLKLKKSLSEPMLKQELAQMAKKNINSKEYCSFLGAGVYDHYIPSVVDHVISRSEFYTAYTPYQPEISQGELQAIFEYQTMIAELTAMDLANSSMYDGHTALSEAAMVSAAHTKRKKILISKAVHPEARDVFKTNAKGQNLTVVEIEIKDGVTDHNDLINKYDENTASVIVQSPNFLGCIEDLESIEKVVHGKKGLFIVSSNPLSLGILKPPGKFKADIVVGDAQPFGIPMQFGGPHCGYFATTKKLTRKVPGRLVGQTTDIEGQRGFVLTLQAREQHIRREKATSNICSNQALNALAAAVSITALGKKGIKEIASQNLQKANYAKREFIKEGFTVLYGNQYIFNEFVIKLSNPINEVNKALRKVGMIGGYDLGASYPELEHHMLLAVTELRTKKEIDLFVQALEGFK